jgi:hypothetical protein
VNNGGAFARAVAFGRVGEAKVQLERPDREAFHTCQVRVIDEFQARNPKHQASHAGQRLPGTDTRFANSRERLIDSLREVGLR